MATQFAINEPDSSKSPNAAYLQLRGSRAQGFRCSGLNLQTLAIGPPAGLHDWVDVNHIAIVQHARAYPQVCRCCLHARLARHFCLFQNCCFKSLLLIHVLSPCCN